MRRLPREELEYFLVQAWMRWSQRNAVIHGGQLKEPGWLNRRAKECLGEYRKAQVTLMATNIPAGSFVWRAPPSEEYKMNFDAAVFSYQQCSGFGAIIRNSNGEVMVGMSAKGSYVHSSEEAEVMACRRMVEFSRDAGFSRLIIEEDCLNVMRLYLIPQRIDCCLAIFMMISSSTLEKCRSYLSIG